MNYRNEHIAEQPYRADAPMRPRFDMLLERAEELVHQTEELHQRLETVTGAMIGTEPTAPNAMVEKQPAGPWPFADRLEGMLARLAAALDGCNREVHRCETSFSMAARNAP